MSDDVGDFDFTNPALTTAPGATSATVSGLYDSLQTYGFVVRAQDAEGNRDTNTRVQSAAAGAETKPPTFSGCTSASVAGASDEFPNAIIVSWGSPASDSATPASLITYSVYTATMPSPSSFDFSSPALTVQGGSSAKLTMLAAGTTYSFIVRASNFIGLQDTNKNVCMAATPSHSMAPSWPADMAGGPPTVTVDSAQRTAVFAWPQASDGQTNPSSMLYDVFQGLAPGKEDFTAPPLATSQPGVQTITVSDLTPDATLYWVIRARNQWNLSTANPT